MESKYRKDLIEAMITEQHVPMGLVLEPRELNELVEKIPSLAASLEDRQRIIYDLSYNEIAFERGQPVDVETQCVMFYAPRQGTCLS